MNFSVQTSKNRSLGFVGPFRVSLFLLLLSSNPDNQSLSLSLSKFKAFPTLFSGLGERKLFLSFLVSPSLNQSERKLKFALSPPPFLFSPSFSETRRDDDFGQRVNAIKPRMLPPCYNPSAPTSILAQGSYFCNIISGFGFN